MEACIGAYDDTLHLAPAATVAGSVNLGTKQFFDVTALMQDVSETRHHGNRRSCFVVKIYDRSLDNDATKATVVPLPAFFDMTPSTTPTRSASQPVRGEGLKASVEEQLNNKTAMSFFCISGGQDGKGKFSFLTTKSALLSQRVPVANR